MKTRGQLAAWEGTGGPIPGAHPCEEQPIRADLALGAWFSPQLEGWAGQARGEGAAGGALEPAVATAPSPRYPRACLLRPRSVAWGERDPNKARAWQLRARLRVGAASERRREFKPDGSPWPSPSGEAARPSLGPTTGPSFGLGRVKPRI